MPSKTLMAVWGALDFALLAAGGLSIAFSIIWKSPDLLRNIVLSNMDLTLGMVLGIFYAVTFVVSIGAVIQQNHVVIGLAILNWLLIVDTLITVTYGTLIWFRTLQMTANMETLWNATSTETRVAVQELLGCCGYRNLTAVEFTGRCPTIQVANATGGCVVKFNAFADYTLMNIFSTIYGFTAILVCLFVATLCVIKKRQEQERFRKIDAKRGGRGFV